MPPSLKPRMAPTDYMSLVRRIRGAVGSTLPPRARVLVVGKGDREIARLGDRPTSHFPQNEAGEYAGYHPVDSTAAIQQLERLRSAGAEYLLLPRTAYWWTEHYAGLFDHLGRTGQAVKMPTDDCRIWALSPATAPAVRPVTLPSPGTSAGAAPDAREIDVRVERLLESLLEPDMRLVHLRRPGEPALHSSRRPVRSVDATPASEQTIGEVLASIKADGADVLLLLGGSSAGRFMEFNASATRQAVERLLPRIAHREHLCSLYDLRSLTGHPVPNNGSLSDGTTDA